MTDYKALYEQELKKLDPQTQQKIRSTVASLEFEVAPYSDKELYDMLMESNKQIAANKNKPVAA